MAVLVVDDITNAHDLVHLIAHLSEALANGEIEEFLGEGTLTLSKNSIPSPGQIEDLVRFGDTDECTLEEHRSGCSCRIDAAATDPRQGTVVDPVRAQGPVFYLPCPRQGEHETLTECWMCWSDVHRNAVRLSSAIR